MRFTRLASLALPLALFALPACTTTTTEDSAGQNDALSHDEVAANYSEHRLILEREAKNPAPDLASWAVYTIDAVDGSGLLAFAVGEDKQVTYGVFIDDKTGKPNLIAFNAKGEQNPSVPADLGPRLKDEFASLKTWVDFKLDDIHDAKISCAFRVAAVGLGAIAGIGFTLIGGWAVLTLAGIEAIGVGAGWSLIGAMTIGLDAAIYEVTDTAKTCRAGFGR